MHFNGIKVSLREHSSTVTDVEVIFDMLLVDYHCETKNVCYVSNGLYHYQMKNSIVF